MSAARVLALAAALLCATAVPPFVRPATAGCGCDHPPPPFSYVMPPFGSPGKTIRIYAQNGSFFPGLRYAVTFLPYPTGLPIATSAVAYRTDRIQVAVPTGTPPGPMSIAVSGWGYKKVYGPELFTALSLPRKMPTGDASVSIKGLVSAVTMDGTLLVPIDLTDVSDATQFAFLVTNTALAFGHDDVVFYNKDGVDLTLFTLQVDDPTARQWGSYHGWVVEDDTALSGVVYDAKVMPSVRPDRQSDLLTYWRHEFWTYKRAHLWGASHWVNADGFHPDGTLHVDHDKLVLAIHAVVRDPSGALKPLAPGTRRIDLLATAAVSTVPLEPEVMAQRAMSSPQYVDMTGSLNDTLSGVTGSTDSVTTSISPLGTTTSTSLTQ